MAPLTVGEQGVFSWPTRETAFAHTNDPDAVEFETCLAEGRRADALALYGQDLLAGFYPPGAGEFERWLETERTRLRRRGADTAWTLAEEADDPAERVQWARQAVGFTPSDETALRRLLVLLDQHGDDIGALRGGYTHPTATLARARHTVAEKDLMPPPRSGKGGGLAAARGTR